MPDSASAHTGDRCPICSNRMIRRYEGVFDDRYGMPALYDLLWCSSCELAKTSPALRDEDLAGIYQTYYPRKSIDVEYLPKLVLDSVSLKGRLKLWIAGNNNQGHYYARPGMKVLDYGCGTGVSLLEIRAQGAEGYGIDVDPNIGQVASRFGLNIHIGSLDDGPFPGMQFDLISLNQVIEHVPDPVRFLKMLKERLLEEGMVVLSFPNLGSLYRRLCGRGWLNWHVPYHIHHFSRRSFTRLCEQEGWKMVRCRTVTPNLWTFLQVRMLLIQPERGIPSPVWSPEAVSKTGAAGGGRLRRFSTRWMNRLRAVVGRVLSWIADIGVSVVNRVIDAIGLGDCLVVTIQPAWNSKRSAGDVQACVVKVRR